MMGPWFFISNVSCVRRDNKAQEYVAKKLKGLEFRTIPSSSIDKFEQYIKDVCLDAKKKNARTKIMTLNKERYILGGWFYSINLGDTSNVVVSFIAIQNRGNWEGGME